METLNAKITYTHLGYEDHGIMTFYLGLDYGGSGQAAGGYALDDRDPLKDIDGIFLGRKATKIFGLTVQAILNTLELQKWEDLPGTHIRVKADDGKVYEIGHLLKNKWLNFKDFFTANIYEKYSHDR